MEAVPRMCMLALEMKISPEPTEFTPKIKQFIRDNYQEDPDRYAEEMKQLDQLRVNAVNATRDFNGCSTLRKYYGQLHLLQSRFPMGEGGAIVIPFTWMDIYSEDYITLCDIRYEQASILYNLGGLHSILGAFDKRTSEEGMKVSCTHFQCAAGAFTYLRDHFGSHLSPDLAHDVLSMYINVMLGQAQECLLEKSMQDNRKSSLVARISQQVADYYSLAIRSLDTSAVSAIMGSRKCKDWKKLLQLKNLHYTSIAFMYMGNQVGEQQKYGERVTYMQASLDRHNEALKLSKGQHESITDALKFTTDVIGGKYNAAKKDNDFVYHESVPSLDKMPEIKGASLVKALPFQPYDDSVAGPDIFKKLVPMEAHEAASLYSEEKAKLLREIASEIEERNQQLDQYLASLQLDQLRLQGKEPERLPQALLEKCAAISVKPTAIKDLVDIMQELSNVVLDVDDGIRQLKQVMEEEDRREEEFQKDFGQRSYPLIMTEIKKEISRYEEGHSKASRSNEELRKAMMIHIGNLKLLAGPLEELQAAIPSSQVVSDSPEDKKIEETLQLLINKIEEMKTQRKTLEKQFRDQLNSDDITNLIVTREDSNMQELFQAELKKHETVMTYIQQNLSAQDNILKAVTDANAQYANTRKSSGEAERLREEKIQALIASYDVYDDLQQKSRKGIEFYRKLEAGVSKLLNRLKGIFKVHEEERQQFLSKLPKKVPSRPSAPKPTMPAEPKQPTTSASKPTGLKLSDLIDPSMLGKGNIQAVIAAGPPMPKGVGMGAGIDPGMLAGPDDIHPGDLEQYGSLPMEMPGHMPGGYAAGSVPGHPAPMPRDSTAAGMPPASVHGLPPTSYPSASAASTMNHHQPTVPHQGFQPSQHPGQPPVPQAQRPGQPPASMALPSSQTQQPPRKQMPPPNQPPQPGPPTSMQQTMGQHPQPDRTPASDLQPGSLNASPEHFARMPPSSASGPPHIPTSGYNAPGHHPPPASQAPHNQPPGVQRAFPSEISRSSTPPSQIPQSQPYSQPPPSGPTRVPPPMSGAPQSYQPQTSMGPPPPGQYTQQQIQPRDYQQDPGRMDGQPSSLDSNASGASIQGFSHTPVPPPANRSEPPPLQGQQPQIAAAGRQMPYQPQPAQSSGTVNSLQTPIATPKQQGMQQPGLQQHSGHDVTSQVHPAGPSYPQQNLPPQHQPQPHQQQQWQQQLPPHPQQQPWSQQQPPQQQQQWQQPVYQQQPVYPQQQQQQPTQQQFPDPSQGRQQPQNQSQPGSMPYQQPYQQHQQLQPPQGGPQQPGMPHQGYGQQQVPGRPQQGQQQGAYPANQSPQHSVEPSPHASPQHKQHYQSQQSLPATSQAYVQPQLPVSSQAYPQQQQYPTQPNTGHPQQGQHPQQPWASPVHQALKGQGQQQWGQQPPQAQQHQQQQPVQQHPPLQPVNPQQPVPQQPSHTQHLPPQQQQQQQQPGHLQQQQPTQQPIMQQHQQPPPQQPQLQTKVQQQQQQLPVHPQQQLAPQHQQPAQQSLQQPYPGQQQWPQKQPQPQPGQQQWQQQPPPPPQQQQQQQQQQSNQPASVQQGQQQWPQQQTQWSQQQPYYGQQQQQQQFQSPKHQPYQQQQVPSSQGPMPATSMAQPQQRPPQPNSPHQQVATSQAYQPPGGPYPQMQQPFQQPSSLPLQGQPTFPQQQHQQQPYQPPASSVPDFAREQERLPQPTIQPIKADSVQKPATDLLSISPENKNSPPIQQPALVPNVIKPEPANTLYEEPKTIPEVKSDPYENKDVLDRFVEEVEKFEKHVEGLSKQTLSGPTILDREWKELSECQMKETKQYSISIARCYSMKNRYPDIMPYDHCRVTISSQKDDYINASMLDGLVPTSPRFIVTQAPVPASISDFWLMVYEKQITVIAMLLSDSEADKKFNIYWPAERGVTMQCGQLLLNLQSTRLSSHWTERRINLTHKETRQSRSIIHLQFSSWPEHGLPENANDLVSYISEVHNYYQSQRSLKIPIVVHCSAGVDRSAIFCLTYAAMTEIQFGNGIINIPKMIRFMRNQRKYMIQEKDQLKFCYEAVLFYAEKSLSKRGIFLRKPVTPGVDQQSQGMHSFDFIMGTNSLQDIQSKISQMTVKPRPVVQQPTNENSDSSDLTNQQEDVIADQVVQVMPNDVMQPAANQVAAGDHVMHKSLSRTNSQDSHGSQGVNSYPPSPSKAPLPQPQQNNQILSGYDSMDSLSSNSSLAASASNPQAQIAQNQGMQNGQEAPKKSTSPSILDNLDPESFTLTASPKQHQKISKATFEERKDALGKENDPNDPLSLLDPLWTLKDKPK